MKKLSDQLLIYLRHWRDDLTPGFQPRTWPRYGRRFNNHYRPLIGETAPALSLVVPAPRRV